MSKKNTFTKVRTQQTSLGCSYPPNQTFMTFRLPMPILLKRLSLLAVLVAFLFSNFIFAQTVVIGDGSSTTGSGVISSHPTGNYNRSISIHRIKKNALTASGLTQGASITEWGYKKANTSAIISPGSWRLKVWLKNVNSQGDHQYLIDVRNGSTLVHEAIITADNFPVEPTYWMWQLDSPYTYNGYDLVCIVEWEALTDQYNNLTFSPGWQTAAPGSLVTGFSHAFYNGGGLNSYSYVDFSTGYVTRISYQNGPLSDAAPLNEGTISASVSNANAGASFSILGTGFSSGTNLRYQWQKSPAGVNQWEDLGTPALAPSLPVVTQASPTDYRVVTSSVTSAQMAISNVLSIGQNENVNFTCPNFKAGMMRATVALQHAKNLSGEWVKPDANGDGEIQITEALDLSVLDFSITWVPVTSLGGLENFTNLKTFGSGYGFILPDVNFPQLPLLEDLVLHSSSIQNIALPQMDNLINLGLAGNSLSNIDLSGVPNVRRLLLSNNQFQTFSAPETDQIVFLFIDNNQLTSLQLQNAPNLEYVYCQNNLLTSLDVYLEPAFFDLDCSFNQLTSLNFHSGGIYRLRCTDNQLQELDLSGGALQYLYAGNNDLHALNIRNGFQEQSLEFANNPNLTYICTDIKELSQTEDAAINNGYTNININDYCSFEHTGAERILSGSARFNSGNGDCADSPMVYPGLRLLWADVYDSANPDYMGDFYTDSQGNFDVQLPYITDYSVLEPMLENPEYFTVSPTQFTFNFQQQPSPIQGNFCITPNGQHHDVEVLMYSLSEPRPGFDVTYRVLLKNRGTEISSGQLTLAYPGPFMDLLSAQPAASAGDNGQITWNYENLNPFENRSYLVTFNMNTPSDSPPLNANSRLDYTLTATPSQTDVQSGNNQYRLFQDVVNSWDPNDKTCLEGTIVSPENIGGYVHYLIRFENTGTASAINVVIKDVIDMEKFDVNSLIPLEGSHAFTTRRRGNIIEFIFENIHLPFEDATNDGFVLFKIKLRNDLVIDDSFSNQAGIYFDYNYPIITNDATSIIQVLSVDQPDTAISLDVFPNPTQQKVQIKAGQKLKSAALFDAQGRLLHTVIINATSAEMDLAGHPTGMYLLKISSEKGMETRKILKK